MAKISKPTKRKGKGLPPKDEVTVTHNLIKSPKNEVTTLNFRVPKSFKKQFKQFAFDHDITMVELLMKSFRNYNGNEITK